LKGWSVRISQKFEIFLAQYKRPDGSVWTGQALEDATGGAVSRSYVSALRNGKIANPRFDKLRAVAKVMGFPPQLWFEETPNPDIAAYIPPAKHGTTISERLETLFRMIPDERTGEPYKNTDVARLTLGTLTEEDVENIRTGAVPDPSVEQVLALAEVFGVDSSYFLDAGTKPPLLDRSAIEGLSDQRSRLILHKSLELSDQEKDLIIDMIDRLEGLNRTARRDDQA
jgi:transcriptional regulator with XRE-family HTH domain